MTGQNEEGLKFDQNKPRMDLLTWEALKGLGNVMGFGATKYGDHNWRKGIKFSRIYAAALRHLLASLAGEDLDPESGLDHIDHLGACWMFLSTLKKTRPDLDDRFKNGLDKTEKKE